MESMDDFRKGRWTNIPIDPLCNYLFDIYEELSEDIFQHYDDLMGDEEKYLLKASSKIDKENTRGSIAFQKDCRKAAEKCHEEFFKEFNKEFEKVEGARKKLFITVLTISL